MPRQDLLFPTSLNNCWPHRFCRCVNNVFSIFTLATGRTFCEFIHLRRFPHHSHVRRVPHLSHLRRSPHLSHVRRSPHLSHLRRSPHLSHLRRSPHLSHVRRFTHLSHVAVEKIVNFAIHDSFQLFVRHFNQFLIDKKPLFNKYRQGFFRFLSGLFGVIPLRD